ncbi:MAG: hypothetical protein M3Q08_07210 [Pseudomonadota bacterium]|nr:hypothetical protein [Pseudomonadota bacterium]
MLASGKNNLPKAERDCELVFGADRNQTFKVVLGIPVIGVEISDRIEALAEG